MRAMWPTSFRIGGGGGVGKLDEGMSIVAIGRHYIKKTKTTSLEALRTMVHRVRKFVL